MSSSASSSPASNDRVPGLVHLTGSRLGTTEILREEALRIGTGPDADIHLSAEREPAVAPLHARLERRGSTYRLLVEKGQVVRVNGDLIEDLVLARGDVLEIGDGGPRLRFRMVKRDLRKSVGEALADGAQRARAERHHPLTQTGMFLVRATGELATQTSPRFRRTFAVALVLLALAVAALTYQSFRLEKKLGDERTRISDVTSLLDRTRTEALTPEALREVRAELAADLSGTRERVGLLEERAEATRRVISEAAESVVFLQGAYGFVEEASGRPLRYVLGPDGLPLTDPSGNPGVTNEGEGPVVESFYTGTGFVVSTEGLILTNRHVALPWESDEAAAAVAAEGYVPTLRRFVGYVAGVPEPFDVKVVAASETADVAVLRCSDVTRAVHPLPLSRAAPAPGDEVLVLGYPTGIRALLARTDEGFVGELMRDGDVDFWRVARRLASAGHIAPLATRGIVGQVTAAAVVYDADTTSGGSGGPVMNLRGEVVAINAAILPEFGGANQGVPIAEAVKLLPGESRKEIRFVPSPEYPIP